MMRLNYHNKSLWCCCLLFAYILTIAVTDKVVAANKNGPKTSEPASSIRKQSGPYCGLYCLYAAMKLCDKKVTFRELLKLEYIISGQGSSLRELKRAAEDQGMYAMSVKNLTTTGLRQSHYPIILHVKPTVNGGKYDHFELFLGLKNDHARIFDPPETVKLVPFHELAARWNGEGLIVFDRPIDTGIIFAPARKQLIIGAAIAIAIILLVHWAKRQWVLSRFMTTWCRLLTLSVAQCAGFALLALLCGIAYHLINNEGFMAHANATASIQQAHAGNFIPKISKKKTRKLLDTNTVFIDARYARDFKSGHLKGALNIPINASDDEYQMAMANITKDTRIVTYCQSASCPFAEKVSIKLMENGFT
ncbi:MAG: hypothetical protein JSW07_04600, partial [bacterium]